MRTGISITITSAERVRLETVLRNRNAFYKHAWRAAIVLPSAAGVGANAIMRRTGTSKTCVWRWQERFMERGVDGLLHDKTRPSRIPALGVEVAARVVALTLTDPPVEARSKCEAWRRDYNEVRPHSAIGNEVPIGLHLPLATPASQPTDEAGFYQPNWSKVGGMLI